MNYLPEIGQRMLFLSTSEVTDNAVDSGNESPVEKVALLGDVQKVEPIDIDKERPSNEVDCSEDEEHWVDTDDLETRLNQSMKLNANLKLEVDMKNQMIEELLDISRHATKELKCAKRNKSEEMKEQESQLFKLEKRLNKLDAEKDDLNKKVIKLQADRLELLEKNLEEKKEKLKLSDLRNTANLKKMEDDNDLKMSALQSQLDQALTTIENLKTRLAEPEKKSGHQRGDAPSRARNENRKLLTMVDVLKKNLDDVNLEKKELELKLKLAETKLSSLDAKKQPHRKKNEKSESGQPSERQRGRLNKMKAQDDPSSAPGTTSNEARELGLKSEKIARLKLRMISSCSGMSSTHQVDELHDGSTRGGKVKIIYEDWIPKVDNNNKESTPNMPTQQ